MPAFEFSYFDFYQNIGIKSIKPPPYFLQHILGDMLGGRAFGWIGKNNQC